MVFIYKGMKLSFSVNYSLGEIQKLQILIKCSFNHPPRKPELITNLLQKVCVFGHKNVNYQGVLTSLLALCIPS